MFFVAWAIAFGWLGAKMQRARSQRELVDRITATGGCVYYDFDAFKLDPRVPRVIGQDVKPPGPDWATRVFGVDFVADVVVVQSGESGFRGPELSAISHLPHLRRLDLRRCSDADLEVIGKVARLEVLRLQDTSVTDAGLEHLASLTKLRELDLSDTKITGKGLCFLRGAPNLTTLYLGGTALTDADLAQLGTLRQVKGLWLVNVNVSDAGLRSLMGMTELLYVDLGMRPRVHQKAAMEFQKALPKCVLNPANLCLPDEPDDPPPLPLEKSDLQNPPEHSADAGSRIGKEK